MLIDVGQIATVVLVRTYDVVHGRGRHLRACMTFSSRSFPGNTRWLLLLFKRITLTNPIPNRNLTLTVNWHHLQDFYVN